MSDVPIQSPIPVIVGPTASGKTEVAILLAERIGGEIINADSRQMYRHLAIGTAAPAPEELARVRHHLVGVVEPEQVVSAGLFRDLALQALADIRSRGRQPIIAGGTGLYIRALLGGLFEGPGNFPEVRAALVSEADRFGPQVLHRRLVEADPEYAAKIHPNDRLRIVRALEVWQATGKPFTWWHQRTAESADRLPATYIGLRWDKRELDSRIRRRVEAMFAGGIQEEVKALLDRGVPPSAHAFEGHGYPEVIALLRGRMSRAHAIESTVLRTVQYARRQMIWFKKEAEIQWIDRLDGDSPETIADTIIS